MPTAITNRSNGLSMATPVRSLPGSRGHMSRSRAGTLDPLPRFKTAADLNQAAPTGTSYRRFCCPPACPKMLRRLLQEGPSVVGSSRAVCTGPERLPQRRARLPPAPARNPRPSRSALPGDPRGQTVPFSEECAALVPRKGRARMIADCQDSRHAADVGRASTPETA